VGDPHGPQRRAALDLIEMPSMPLVIQPITEERARAASAWRYPGPYAIYDHEQGDWQRFLEPAYRYHAVLDGRELIGYCCFGDDARVPGGEYPPDALDVGAGMRPDLVGQGLGSAFLAAILEFGRTTYAAPAFAATVAAFNQRALALCRAAGFRELSRFISTGDEPREFVILVRS
jgi:[ribosomal protein S18]-alanine N-acetyltransferase